MKDYLRLNHAEVVEDPRKANGPVYYMPHHAIIKDDRKTTKLRIVFDASSHEAGALSLNDCQFAGPSLNPDIVEMLMQFRLNKVAIAGDLEKAFLQIGLNELDRDATRFLWVEDDWQQGQPLKIKVLRMSRVLFGMKASPYLLAAAIRHHARKYEDTCPITSKLLDQNLYVDDFITGAATAPLAHRIYQEAKTIMAAGGMRLCKWATNNDQLRRQWYEEGELPEETVIEPLKILGMMWDQTNDTLFFPARVVLEKLAKISPTKRGILEIAAHLYDPLGFLAPVIVTLKCLLQELWKQKIDWDTEIPPDLQKKWGHWCKEFDELPRVRVDRWYGTEVEGQSVSATFIL